MIDHQEGFSGGGASGNDLGVPFSLWALLKSALTHHLPRRDGGTAYGSRAPSGGGSARGAFPASICQQMPTAACASGGASPMHWGALTTNKLRRVYTGALLTATYYQHL